MKYFVIAIVIVIAAIRPFTPPHPVSLQGSYEAMAHIVVGGLIGAWLVNRQQCLLWTFLGFSQKFAASFSSNHKGQLLQIAKFLDVLRHNE